MSLDCIKDEYRNHFLRDDVCRFCSNKNASISLQSSPQTENKLNLLLDNIKYCLGIEIRLENKPKAICEGCKDKIEHFAYFKRLCLESEESLLKFIKKEDTEVDKKPFTDSRKVEVEISLSCPAPNVEVEINADSNENVSNTHISDSGSECSFEGAFDNFKDTKLTKNKAALETKTPVKLKKSITESKISSTYCKKCQIGLSTYEEYSKHNLEIHGVGMDGLYNCFGCERRFQKPQARTAHETRSCLALKDGFKCSLCNQFLPTRDLFECHMSKQHNCGHKVPSEKVYQRKKRLDGWFNTEHSLKTQSEGKRSYVCETCGRVFSKIHYLYIHKKTHTVFKQYKCTYCDYRCHQRSALTVHVRRHTGERPYSCHICSQQCINKSNLTRHLRTHDDVKIYECKICQKRFAYKTTLEFHMSSVHGTGVPYPCEVCGAIYRTNNALGKHRRKKHRAKGRKTIGEGEQLQTDLKNNEKKLIVA